MAAGDPGTLKRNYSSIAVETTLSASLASAASGDSNTVNVAAISGFPGTAPYTLILDPDTSKEEIITVTVTGTTALTALRGQDGTSAVAHAAGATVRHGVSGREFKELQTHIAARGFASDSAILSGVDTHVHGIATGQGDVVGTAKEQTLTNKTISGASNTISNINLASQVTGTLPVANGGTGITSLGTGVATFLGTPSSANLRSAVTDETGSGALVFGTSPTIDSPTITGTGTIAGTFTGNITGNVTGNASTATTLATARNFQITGDVEASAVSFNGSGNVSLTSSIAAGAIVNADVNASAAIAYSKLNLSGSVVNADIATGAAIDKTKISGTAITAGDSGTVTSAMIADGTIVNADIASGAAIALSKLATDPLARANHTGTQTASTISDFDTQVRTNRLDQMTAPTGSVSMNSQKITSLGTPTISTDAATKAYVDAIVGGAPGALDTLNELAAALNNDANFSTTVTNSLAGKLNLSGGTMTGAIAMGTNKITGLGNPTNAQDAATKYYIDNSVIAPANLTGPITSVGNATAIASQTGTGTTFVVQTSPTINTPTLSSPAFSGQVSTDIELAAARGVIFEGATNDIYETTLVATDPTADRTVSLPNATTTLVGTDTTDTLTNKTINGSSNTITNVSLTSGVTGTLPVANGGTGQTTASNAINALVPTQTSNSGKYLTTNGTAVSWGTVDALPSQTGNSGKYLTTNGTSASWASIVTDPTPSIFMLMGA